MVDLSEVAVDIVAGGGRGRAFGPCWRNITILARRRRWARRCVMSRTIGGRWLALAVFSAPAFKCGARDRWIGWDRGLQFGRLHLITNNARFLILPGGPRNLGSRVLSLCAAPSGQRLADPLRPRIASRGNLRGSRILPGHGLPRRQPGPRQGAPSASPRKGPGYDAHGRPKIVFLLPLSRNARTRLRAARLDPGPLRHGIPRISLTAAQMWSLHDFFLNIDDSPPPPGTAPWPAHNTGPGRRRDALRHARLQGDQAHGSTISVPRNWHASMCAAAAASAARPACRRYAAR